MGNFTIRQTRKMLRLHLVCSLIFLSWGFAASQAYALSVDSNREILAVITGTVQDETGAPLPGAAILVKGTTNGTITDLDGNFSIDVPADAVLVISYLGYTAQEVSVNGRSSLSIQLEPDARQLDELVVVGYGTQKRSDVTGAIGSVKNENFNRGVITNPVDLLQGKIAGVNITSTSGEPGANQNVIIRGIGSLRSGTQPLYVLDGFFVG
ncbi:carboxypeptidase-like regulatory domain-containing protein [Algoriphagus boritolerans]|uniref:carboxypeptidase-like regulatory domain-containing protein n=1 Tax=Algoriphagus boritolerans TaxID=308111 RepID=UPI000B2F87C5